MPWLSLPFADRGRKAALSKQYKVGASALSASKAVRWCFGMCPTNVS